MKGKLGQKIREIIQRGGQTIQSGKEWVREWLNTPIPRANAVQLCFG